jgi:hypothetical protein
MPDRARRLTAAFAIVGAIALGTAGPSIAHHIMSKHQLQATRRVIVSPATDDDYVSLLIRATRPEW